MRQLLLHARHEVSGAVFVDRAGWQVPSSYSNLDDEVGAGRTAAGVIDLSDRMKVVGDLWVYALEDALLLDLLADESVWVLEHINKHLVSDDVTLEPLPAVAHLGLHGPLAP